MRSLLGSGDTVLDLGCGSGDVGRYLVEAGITVDGVELDGSRAMVAQKYLRHVVQGPIGVDSDELQEHYTAVIFVDVLEHLLDPHAALKYAATKASRIFAYIPNAAHYSVRWKILRGDWSYHDSGMFDRDHVRFYDLTTMYALVEEAGLNCNGMWPTVTVHRHVPRKAVGWWPELFASAALLDLRAEEVQRSG